MKRLVVSSALVLTSLSIVLACESESSSSSSGTVEPFDAGSFDSTTPMTDSAVVTPGEDSAVATDAPADTGLTKACDDLPDAGVNPTCGVVGQCGQLVTPTTDPNDMPVGVSTSLPTGTYVLVGLKAYKGAPVPPAQIRTTLRLHPGMTYEFIMSGVFNNEPSPERRESGTYAVAGGKLTLTEVCPNPSTDSPVTFTVSGNTVTTYLPQGGGAPGQGLAQTFALFL